MQQEFIELFKNLKDLIAIFSQEQEDAFKYLEEMSSAEESVFYKELKKRMETLKIHENAIKKIREEISDKIKEQEEKQEVYSPSKPMYTKRTWQE